MADSAAGHRLVISNDVAQLRVMTKWLWENGTAAGIARELLYTLDVCANEAVINIIQYAYADSGRHEIALLLDKTPHGARLIIRDDGQPFNLLEAPERIAPTSLAAAQIGGLGIHLIRHLISSLEYKHEHGINVVTLEAQPETEPGER